MSVSREDVVKLAELARLRLSPEEVEPFTEQLNTVLAHAKALEDLDVAGTEPVGDSTEWSAPLRAETASPDTLERPVEELAPAWRAGFFTVPRVAAIDAAESDDPFEDKASARPETRAASEERKGGGA